MKYETFFWGVIFLQAYCHIDSYKIKCLEARDSNSVMWEYYSLEHDLSYNNSP